MSIPSRIGNRKIEPWVTGGGGGSQSSSGTALTVKEVDGSPSVANVNTIVFPNGTVTDDGAGQVTITVGAPPFDDATAIIKGSSDATKLLRIEVDGLSTGTTRVLTPQNSDYILAGINIAQTFTAAQIISSNAATAFAVGADVANPALKLICNVGSSVTGLSITSRASGAGVSVDVLSSGTDDDMHIAPKGTGGITITGTAQNLLAVGPNKFTTPTLRVDCSTASRVTGLQIKGAASGGDIALNVISNATDESIKITPKGAGNLKIGSGVILMPSAGTAAAPWLASISEVNTGYYVRSSSPAASVGGTEVYGIGTTAFHIRDTMYLGWVSGADPTQALADTRLRRFAAANIAHGAADAASIVAQTISVQNVLTGTSNTAGASWTFDGSRGTGTGAGGSIIFRIAPAGSSGSSQNAYVSALTINATAKISVGVGVDVDGGGVKHTRVTTGSVTAGATALVTITWTTAFADANYTVVASVVDSTTSDLSLTVVHVETISSTQVAVRVKNGAVGSLTGTLHVVAIHD